MTPPAEGSGGHTTAFRLVAALEAAGHRCRVHLYDLHASDLAHHEQLIRRCWPDVKADVANAFDGMPDAHATFATSWPTAYLVHRDKSLGRRFYLVQDMEPDFYPAGSEAALAEMTYRFGFHGVTAGAWLAKTLDERYGMSADAFSFGVDLDRYAFRDEPRQGIAFFARTTTPCRAFQLAVLALQSSRRRTRTYRSTSSVRDRAACPSPRRSRSPLPGRAGRALQQLLGRARAVDDERVARSPRDAGRRLRTGHERRRAQPCRARWRTGPICASRAASTGFALGEVVAAADRGRAREISRSVEGASWADAGQIVDSAVRRQVAGAFAVVA